MTHDHIPVPRQAVLAMSPEQFRTIGHGLVDRLADFLADLPAGPVTHNDTAAALRALLPAGGIPEQGEPADELLSDAATLLTRHSLLNAHPCFFGYMRSSPTPWSTAASGLRACIVNFRTEAVDIDALVHLVERIGGEIMATRPGPG